MSDNDFTTITPRGEKTELRFTHKGLVLTIECYGGCSGAWGFCVGESLRSLITTGTGLAQRRRLAGQPDGASLAAHLPTALFNSRSEVI